MSGDLYTGPRLVGSLRARPTVYRGIHMRSRLEASYAAILDDWGSAWEYEPECFADETGQYLPDFLQLLPGSYMGEALPEVVAAYTEVKPDAIPGPVITAVRRRMEIIWASVPDAALYIWTPGSWTWFAGPPSWDGPNDPPLVDRWMPLFDDAPYREGR